MITNRRKHRLVRDLGMYFAEKGKILRARDYKTALDRPNFLSMKEIVKVMGSYTTAIEWIEKYEPELWDTIHGVKPAEPEPAPKKPSGLEALAAAKTGK